MMVKFVFQVMALLWVTACSAHDDRYYQLHPKALQKAIAECPNKQPSTISCDQLKQIAFKVNQLGYQLRLNPQDYGKKILALQELIATQESSLRASPNQTALQSSLVKNKQRLEERLAIVKWLESPES